MIVRLLLAIIIIVALFFFLRWFRNKPARQISQTLKTIALYVCIGLIIFLAISGRLHWLFALLASLLPFAKRLLPLLRYIPLLSNGYRRYQARRTTSQTTKPGQHAPIETRFIRMTLNHDSGRIDGTIIDGPLSGKNLSQLGLQQLLTCWRHWQQQDQESARLLEAFLDQSHAPQWREQTNTKNNNQTPPDGRMTQDEALAILGLEHPANHDEIIQAHRHLISKLHPDRGGSTYLTAKINQARDLLLKRATT